jgi:ATP-dependent helicase HepA
MEQFYPNQRYTSKGEPELGIGIVTETSKGKVEIQFPLSETTRLYAMESAPLLRVVFKPGDTITDKSNQSMLIERVALDGELYSYFGKSKEISEAELGNVSANHGVDDRLFMGDVDTPQAFALRRETLKHEYKRRISPVNGFVGGRIDLIPHQLYIAHEVSSRYAPRVLLSDQVGLGKTIEACLILHRLLLSGRISRVLILVPESLVHQWFVEVLRRFNMWFNIFDEERCASLDEGAPDGNPFFDNQLIICSTEFLAGSSKRTQQAINANWDMLVVDEAHNLEWTVEKASPEYSVVELLSMVAKGLLLLTATPEQLGTENHFARLRLIDPNRYENYDDFINESNDHKAIANIVEKLHLGKDLNTKETKTLASIFPKERIDLLAKGGDVVKDNLIEDLLDQHGPGRVLFRNTRSAISGFPKRKAHLIAVQARENSELWLDRLSHEFAFDIGQTAKTQKQEYWFDEDPRVHWLLKKLEELSSEKILLICKSKEKVLALEQALIADATLKVGVFHEELTIVQRDRNAAWFSESDGAQILLCSEIGSEGRNFQFAHHLVLFDLPLHPELLEQRIGRLDRIGQKEDIHIHIPFIADSPQQKLVRWFHEGLNAFEKNLEGGNEIFKLFSDRLISVSKEAATSAFEILISETATFHKELQKNLADGRDRLLEMNSFRPAVAKKLIEQIEAEDRDKGIEMYFTKVFKHFDVEMEDLAARTYFLHPTSMSSEIFPTITGEGISVTFDRKRALSREDISFLSWEHPLTTDSIDMVLSSGTGSASFGVLRGSGSAGLLMEILFVLETSKVLHADIDRFLPKTPLRVLVDHTGKEVSADFAEEILDKKLISGQIDPLLDNETFAETILPNMIAAATGIAEEKRTQEIENGLRRMNLSLKHEIDRLQALQGKNKNIRPEEIQIAVDEQTALTSLIKNARIRMDAIQVIKKD